MDFGQYKYDQAKRQREARKRQKVILVKEIKMRPRISIHDYNFKMRHAKNFLAAGDKVRFVVMFRGRELSHMEQGEMLLNKIAQELEENVQVESPPRREGRIMNMVVAPKSVSTSKKASG